MNKTASDTCRLEGLESDNLLAFLALLGLLRALEADDRGRGDGEKLWPRAAWDLDSPPLRPVLAVKRAVPRDALLEAACRGIDVLAEAHDFAGRKDLNYPRAAARALLEKEASMATPAGRDRIDLLAALMTDGAVKDEKEEAIDPTPLCLLFGQGHQHFLDRLAAVPRQPAPPARRRSSTGSVSAVECLAQALFHPWSRSDPTFSFRWDPEEDVRYALMAGDPTDAAYKTGTQHGANRLAAVGLPVLIVAPEVRAGRVRPTLLGGGHTSEGFSFCWPIWRDFATLSAIRALLGHPDLREPAKLAHLGVDHVLVAHRISVGKFMNFTRARPMAGLVPAG